MTPAPFQINIVSAPETRCGIIPQCIGKLVSLVHIIVQISTQVPVGWVWWQVVFGGRMQLT